MELWLNYVVNGVDCTPANEAAEIANAVQRNDFPTDELYAFAVMNKSLIESVNNIESLNWTNEMDRSLMNRTITMYNDENIINTGDIMSSPDQFYKSVNSSSTAESDLINLSEIVFA
ncbi:unnamed protein product [Dracunculus medinensis]|uniref:Peptidase_M13_N domain-containing protein n=1 Tax=Dracunculus medinensis TaxID=318479 RepID=A0A0N4UJL9_DRAME|nr:unnamed protein product [Dracunculus medinensis]